MKCSIVITSCGSFYFVCPRLGDEEANKPDMAEHRDKIQILQNPVLFRQRTRKGKVEQD